MFGYSPKDCRRNVASYEKKKYVTIFWFSVLSERTENVFDVGTTYMYKQKQVWTYLK